MGEFDDLMIEGLTIYPKAGFTAHGPTFSDGYEELVYAEPGSRIAIDQQGQEVLCNLWTVHPAESLVSIQDEAVWDEKRYTAIAVDKLRMDGAVHHVEVSWRGKAT